MTYFDTNASNNTNDGTFDDAYDGKIRDKISDIRAILSRLGNIVTKNDREKIKKELYEIENKTNLSDKEKGKIDDNLLKLVNKLNKKEKHRYHYLDDLDYHGLTDIENAFDNIDDDYYKPILVKSSFNESYKYYESRGDKDKKISIEQYLKMIKPYLIDLINENKAIETSSNEWKIQINMHINFVSSNDTGEVRTMFVWSDSEEIRLCNETDDIIKRLINSFLNNYQKEELILRNGSNFLFESVGLLSYHIHKTSLKRGNSYTKSHKWIANKKAIINPKNVDDRCFEYYIVVALHHKIIKKLKTIQKEYKLFIIIFSFGYNWGGRGYRLSSRKKEWKRFLKK